MNRIATLAAIAAALLGAPAAWARGGVEEDPAEAHANTDLNEDGRVDRLEFSVRAVDVFYFADADRSGTITVVEFERTNMGPFPEHAAGSDEELSLYEFTDEVHMRFRAADTDRDGALSVDEVKRQRERVMR